jgi:hypothetical protein
MKKEKRVRAESSAATAKNQTEKPELHYEYSGHIITRRQWFKMGLSPAEMEALKSIHQGLWVAPGTQTLAKTLRLVAICALARHEVWLEHLREYGADLEASGGLFLDVQLDEVIRKKFNLPKIGGRSITPKGGAR